MKKLYFFILIGFLLNVFLFASDIKIDNYKFVLEHYVDSRGFVDYKSLKLNSKTFFLFINSLHNYSFEEYSRLEKNDKIVFWINLYNATLLDLVIKKYPINPNLFHFYKSKNIKNLGNLNNIKVKVFGEIKTLKYISYKILELDMQSSHKPRAIFALTFITKDAPNLKNSLYNPNLLYRDLDEQVRKFIFNEKNYKLDKKYGVLYLSGFFDKYSYFFTKTNKTLNSKLTSKENRIINFLLDYVLLDDKKYLETAYYKIIFNDYDYFLNEI